MRSSFWQELTTRDFAGLDPEKTIALLPVAAIEQHGPHLPLATDAIINEGIITEALDRLPDRLSVLVLPALTVGSSLEHTAFAGTLSIDAETLLATWKQIGACVARAGIRKLVILNTHGGQTALVDIAALQLRADHAMLVARANYSRFGTPASLFSAEELAEDIHGGLVETSLMLHLRPELVDRDAIEAFAGLPGEFAKRNDQLGVEKPIGFGWMSQDLHPSGACGNAAGADARRGKAYLGHVADTLVTLLAEVTATPLSVIANGSANN
jgi:creatinine amidohydrolase